MQTIEESQDPLFIEDRPLLSMLFLDIAVVPSLSKHEAALLLAAWHRTSRFGYVGSTKLTYPVLRDGAGETEVFGGIQAWQADRFPVYPDLSERQYKRSLAPLLRMSLLTRTGVGLYRISCYPRDFVDQNRRLIDALTAEKTAESTAILQNLTRLTDSLRRFKTL